MSIEINKQLVRDFATRFSAADWEGLAELLADDFRWIVPAVANMQSDSLQAVLPGGLAGDRSKEETLAIFRNTVLGCRDQQFTIAIGSMTAEGDRVSAEAEGDATSVVNGRHYRNRYHYLMTMRDGKIAEFREYQDTLHTADVWLAK